jgi:hypothetical protein
MRLSLAGWPPIASHATCLLVGLALAHLSEKQSHESPRFSPQMMIFSLDPKSILEENSTKNLRLGTKLVMTEKLGHSSCRLHDSPVDVLAIAPQIVLALSIRDPYLHTVVDFLRQNNRQKSASEASRLERPKIQLEISSKSTSIPLCRRSPTVIYE